ncbi:MAG: aminotransferase class IV family protein [Desulfamplus sp.]|nr:aminotransferase class IV family protein [Desulfamplus sp.]
MNTYYVDGKFIHADKAVIPVDDLAVLRGVGVFDLMRTHKGKPCFLKEHVERLRNSAIKIDLKIEWSSDELEQIILQTLDLNQHIDEANIRVIITGGSSPDFMTVHKPRLLVLITKIPPIPAVWYEKGVKVITVLSQRDIPEAKSLSYIPATIALKKAKSQDAIEALYVDKQGFVTEGTTSNLFAFINNELITADKNVLKGVTRKAIISMTEKMFTLKLETLRIEKLLKADEVFITGTNKRVVPVIKIDDTVIGDGTPGKHTKRIIEALDKSEQKS